MKLRTLAATAVTIAITLSLSTAGPSLAKAGGERGGHDTADSARPATARVEGREEARARKAEAQARRKARFLAVGIVTAVGENSITLAVKGGSPRGLRGKTQAFTVPAGASIIRNGKHVALSAILVGDHAMVKGLRSGDTAGATYTTHKVRAQSREDKPAESSSTPAPSS